MKVGNRQHQAEIWMLVILVVNNLFFSKLKKIIDSMCRRDMDAMWIY